MTTLLPRRRRILVYLAMALLGAGLLALAVSPLREKGCEPRLRALGRAQRLAPGLRTAALRAMAAVFHLRRTTGCEALARYRLGAVHAEKAGGSRQAEEAYREAFRIAAASASRSQEGKLLYLLGRNAFMDENDEVAWRFFDRALKIQAELGDGERQAKTLSELGGIAVFRGDLGAALSLLGEAQRLAGRSKDLETEAYAAFSLGKIHRRRGDYEAAVESESRALEINRSLAAEGHASSPLDMAAVLIDLGSAYFYLGDLESAQECFERARQLGHEQRSLDFEAISLSAMGRVYQAEGDARRALDRYAEALDFFGRAGTPDLQKAHTLRYQGIAYRSLRQPAQALPLLERALAIYRQKNRQSRQAQTLVEIGSALADLNRYAGARQAFREAETLSGDQAEILALIEYREALLERPRGAEAALARVSQAIERVEAARNRVSNQQLRATFFASRREYYDLKIELLMELARGASPAGYTEEALETSEQSRARVLLDLLSRGQLIERLNVAPPLKRQLLEVQAELQEVSTRIVDPAESERESVDHLVARQRGLLATMEQIQGELERQDPRATALSAPKPMGSRQIQALLQPDEAFLEYFLGREASHLFVVTREGFRAWPLPAAPELARDVERLRQSLERRADLAEDEARRVDRYAREAYELYRKILAPAAQEIAGKRALIIAPDGALALLPFEALLLEPAAARPRAFAAFPYLIRRYAVSYTPSAGVLASLRKPAQALPASPAAGRLVVFADPLYERRRDEDLPPLVASGDEARRIAALFPAHSQVYAQAAASEENVKRNPAVDQAGFLHFAVHGSADAVRPERSALALTPTPGEDGKLTVREILGLHLNADLVVLSACQTALGRQVEGEGILGLARAFLHAGARSVSASLWRVSDSHTPDLMVDFYRELRYARSKPEALRQAKLNRIDSREAADPYYWAPFILVGDPAGKGPL